MKRIVVVGAGFGGLQAVTQLDSIFCRDRDVEILLLSDQNYLLFTPLLPQIASSYTDPRHIVQAVREIRGRRKFQFRREAVRAVDAPHGVTLPTVTDPVVIRGGVSVSDVVSEDEPTVSVFVMISSFSSLNGSM